MWQWNDWLRPRVVLWQHATLWQSVVIFRDHAVSKDQNHSKCTNATCCFSAIFEELQSLDCFLAELYKWVSLCILSKCNVLIRCCSLGQKLSGGLWCNLCQFRSRWHENLGNHCLNTPFVNSNGTKTEINVSTRQIYRCLTVKIISVSVYLSCLKGEALRLYHPV